MIWELGDDVVGVVMQGIGGRAEMPGSQRIEVAKNFVRRRDI
jgi:hypothetical protein